MADDHDIPFPKPARKPKRRRSFTSQQQQTRIRFEKHYRHYARPEYLLDLARRQGRLPLADEEIEGETPKEKHESLPPGMKPLCEIRAPGTECSNRGGKIASTVHHKRGRMKQKHAPHLLTDKRYFAGTCVECHDYVESHRDWARENGWLERRNT